MGQFEFWLFVSRSRKFKLTHHQAPGVPRRMGRRSALTLPGHFVIQHVWLIAPKVRQGDFAPARGVPNQKNKVI